MAEHNHDEKTETNNSPSDSLGQLLSLKIMCDDLNEWGALATNVTDSTEDQNVVVTTMAEDIHSVPPGSCVAATNLPFEALRPLALACHGLANSGAEITPKEGTKVTATGLDGTKYSLPLGTCEAIGKAPAVR